MKNLIKNLFTENDGKSWDVNRIMGFIAFCVLTIKFLPTEFAHSAMVYGGSVASILGALAAHKFMEGTGGQGHGL